MLISNIVCIFLYIFPAPRSDTAGWHPLTFSKTLKNKPKRINFIDEAYVIWRGENNKVHVKYDCCPHQGSLLSKGTIDNNCITCPYHGLSIGPYDNAYPHGRELVGMVKEHQGIIWWTKNIDDNTEIPNCKELENRIDTQQEFLIKASFNDCWRNACDFHHPAHVHRNSFGNSLDSPSDIEEEWITPNIFRSTFKYEAKESYKSITGKMTNNYHEFVLPSTTYNCVSNTQNNKRMTVHVAMRAETPQTTRWFVSSSNTFVNVFFAEKVVEHMINKVVKHEDGFQLERMADDETKIKHSYKFKLPLDYVIDSLSKQNKPYILEQKLLNISFLNCSGNKKVELSNNICEELVTYNNSYIDMMTKYKYTNWSVLISHYRSPKTQTVEYTTDSYATETTIMTNGTTYIMNANFKVGELNKGYFFNLHAKMIHPSGFITYPQRLPFDSHGFTIYYVSDNIMIRKGDVTNKWEIFYRKE